MADEQISDLPAGGAVQAADKFVVARAGASLSVLGSVVGVTSPSSFAREQINGPGYTTIANNATALLPWAKGSGGDPGDNLLDFTVPTLPTVTQAGVFAVVVTVRGLSLTTGGFINIQLSLDVGGSFTQAVNESRTATAARPSPSVQASTTYYIPSGGSIQIQVINRDGSASRDFIIDDAYIQRVA